MQGILEPSPQELSMKYLLKKTADSKRHVLYFRVCLYATRNKSQKPYLPQSYTGQPALQHNKTSFGGQFPFVSLPSLTQWAHSWGLGRVVPDTHRPVLCCETPAGAGHRRYREPRACKWPAAFLREDCCLCCWQQCCLIPSALYDITQYFFVYLCVCLYLWISRDTCCDLLVIHCLSFIPKIQLEFMINLGKD